MGSPWEKPLQGMAPFPVEPVAEEVTELDENEGEDKGAGRRVQMPGLHRIGHPTEHSKTRVVGGVGGGEGPLGLAHLVSVERRGRTQIEE